MHCLALPEVPFVQQAQNKSVARQIHTPSQTKRVTSAEVGAQAWVGLRRGTRSDTSSTWDVFIRVVHATRYSWHQLENASLER